MIAPPLMTWSRLARPTEFDGTSPPPIPMDGWTSIPAAPNSATRPFRSVFVKLSKASGVPEANVGRKPQCHRMIVEAGMRGIAKRDGNLHEQYVTIFER